MHFRGGLNLNFIFFELSTLYLPFLFTFYSKQDALLFELLEILNKIKLLIFNSK